MADMKKRQELISKSAKEELNIRQKNEESLKQQKEDLREMARLGQQMTATQKKAYDALVKADKKVVINRAEILKWGIKIADVTIFFSK